MTMTENTPPITVLIPTYNRARYLAECLDSILGQTLRPAQIIVVNDGSTDDTRDVLAPYMDRIDYLETNQLGKPSALNHGLERVKGEYVWIFDDDDVAMPDALERLVRPLEKHPEYGFSYGSFYFTRSGKDGRIGEVINELFIPDVNQQGFLIPLLETNFLGGAALFARTACYRKLGGFDPELMRSQDYEMAIRIARQYKGVRVNGGPLFHYRQHNGVRGPNQDSFAPDKRFSKWKEYGKLHFRKNFKIIPLDEYLPPGESLEMNKRQALLQRCKIMAYRHLMPEIIQDLRVLGELDDPRPISDREYTIIHDTIFCNPYPGEPALFEFPDYFDAVRELSNHFPAVRGLRAKIWRIMLRHCLKTASPRLLIRTLVRVGRMYGLKCGLRDEG